MRNSNNPASLLTILCILVVFGLACGGSATQTSTNVSAPVNKSGETTTANIPAPADRTVIHSPTNVEGSYSITGSDVNGAGEYDGIMNATKRGDVYQLSWAVSGKTYDGVGVLTRDTLAVAFTEGADGTGCGVVLYDIAANGDLTGKAGYWGVNEIESETAKRSSGNDLAGKYDVSGKNSDGENYKGSLDVKKDGDGYAFEWNTGSIVKGFGIRQGNTASIGIGGAQCNFIAYEVRRDGTLEGKWGAQGSTSFGTETAKRK